MDESARENASKEQITAERSEAEIKRLRKLLVDAGTSENRIKMLEPVIENTAWMKAKLDDARGQIRGSSIAVPYNNGGGQKGLRENPLFKGYEALWRCYMAGMSKILESLPAEVQAEAKNVEVVENPRTVLEIVRAKHKKEA